MLIVSALSSCWKETGTTLLPVQASKLRCLVEVAQTYGHFNQWIEETRPATKRNRSIYRSTEEVRGVFIRVFHIVDFPLGSICGQWSTITLT